MKWFFRLRESEIKLPIGSSIVVGCVHSEAIIATFITRRNLMQFETSARTSLDSPNSGNEWIASCSVSWNFLCDAQHFFVGYDENEQIKIARFRKWKGEDKKLKRCFGNEVTQKYNSKFEVRFSSYYFLDKQV